MTNKQEIPSKVKPRPPLFQALGKDQPPKRIVVDGGEYFLKTIFKHDSWAATALYESNGDESSGGGSGKKKIVCKFNRRQSIFGFPMSWLGRFLARHEAYFYCLLADLPCVPRGYKNVIVDGVPQQNAFAHDYVEGRPLRRFDSLPQSFYDDLEAQLVELHRRGGAYMDLHKPENIILGEDGRPHLVDFQVSAYVHPDTWLWSARVFLLMFQQGDKYHLGKHRVRMGEGNELEGWKITAKKRPFWIRVHRFFAVPFRALRRNLLVLLGIRSGKGNVQSEYFVEDGMRFWKESADENVPQPTGSDDSSPWTCSLSEQKDEAENHNRRSA